MSVDDVEDFVKESVTLPFFSQEDALDMYKSEGDWPGLRTDEILNRYLSADMEKSLTNSFVSRLPVSMSLYETSVHFEYFFRKHEPNNHLYSLSNMFGNSWDYVGLVPLSLKPAKDCVGFEMYAINSSNFNFRKVREDSNYIKTNKVDTPEFNSIYIMSTTDSFIKFNKFKGYSIEDGDLFLVIRVRALY